MDDDVKKSLTRLQGLKNARSTWEGHWQELAEYFLPRRADFSGAGPVGAKRTDKQFDGTPMLAARNLAAAIDGLLKPKNARWFNVRLQDGRAGERDDVRRWLQHAENILFQALYDPRARFVQYSSEVDLDLVVFGTGVLYVGETVGTGALAFRAHHLKNSYLAVGEDGNVDTLFLSQKLTARQAEQRFGRANLGAKTLEALDENDPDTEFEFIRVCQPRFERDLRRADNANLPFSAIDIDMESEHKIAESGFHEFPYVVPRWETSTGENYGRSPAMLALPDAKTLNQMSKTLLKAGHKAVDPPLLAPSDSLKSAMRTWPGGISYFDAGVLTSSGGRVPIQPLTTGANVPLGREMQKDVRDQIWNAFFRNIMSLPTDQPGMTATEVLERKQEFIRVIGPVFGRLEADYTGPLVERVFAILMRAGAFGEPPAALLGETLKFEYVSPISKAHKLVEVGAYTKTSAELAPLAQADPGVLDNFDSDRIARGVAEANGMPLDWLRAEEAIDGDRQGRAEAEATEAAKLDAERLASGAAKLGGAGINPDILAALDGGGGLPG
jgi:hypothetical protein